MTLLELVIGIAVLAVMGLVLAGLLKGSIVSSGRSAEVVFLLSNARKALNGGGSFGGMMGDAAQAQAVGSVAPDALTLVDREGVRIAYTLSSAGELTQTSLGTSTVRAQDISGLSAQYYGRDAGYHVFEASDPSAVDLVTVSFKVPGKSRTVRMLSGSRLMNRP